MFNRINALKVKGYSPDIILDIGANHGNWTRDMLNIYNCKYLLFEANYYDDLNQYNNFNNIKVYNKLLSDKIEEVLWYQINGTGDSMFKEQIGEHYKNCEGTLKLTTTLNDCLNKDVFIDEFKNIFIKIDCQGAEISILKGAIDILHKTDFILLEMPLFGQYNQNVPNFLEHIKFMDSIGFNIYDIVENHYINDFNMQIDAIFINKHHPFNVQVNGCR
jgi:FkbM family methyltransferase